jgi:hypothetical protein
MVSAPRTRSQRAAATVREPEGGSINLADQKERVACNDLAKTDQRRGRIEVARFHHPHRSAPRQVDRAVEQTRDSGARRRRGDQIDRNALACIEAKRMGGVERRIEHRAKILGEPYPHGRRRW